MGVNRTARPVKVNTIDDKTAEDAYQSIKRCFFGQAPDLTTDEVKTLLESMGASEIAKDRRAFYRFLKIMREFTGWYNFTQALNFLDLEGIPAKFLVELTKKDFTVSRKRERGYKTLADDDVKLLYKTKENLDNVAHVLYGYLIVPEYYKLKKTINFDRAIDYLGGYETFGELMHRAIVKDSKRLSYAKKIIELTGTLESLGFKINDDINKSKPKQLRISIDDINLCLSQLDYGKLKELKEMMLKYNITTGIYKILGTEENIAKFGAATANLSNEKKEKLLLDYVTTISDKVYLADIIATLAENKIPPPLEFKECYGHSIGYIGCKFCHKPCNSKERRSTIEAVCGDCFYYKLDTCTATYKNLIDGKCILESGPGPLESSTLRCRF